MQIYAPILECFTGVSVMLWAVYTSDSRIKATNNSTGAVVFRGDKPMQGRPAEKQNHRLCYLPSLLTEAPCKMFYGPTPSLPYSARDNGVKRFSATPQNEEAP